jgi:glycosyltransferase involved in cell wall biosynthesis
LKHRVILNISTVVDWRGTPSGIVRVEYELLKQLYKLTSGSLVAVYLEKSNFSFRLISKTMLDKYVRDDCVFDDEFNYDYESELLTFIPDQDDKFISVGSDWSFNVPEIIAKLYDGKKVLIAACYDLIPLILPEYTPGPEFQQQFLHHYTAVSRYANSVFSISENSKKDLLIFWDRANISLKPPVKVVPLAGFNSSTKLPLLEHKEKIDFFNLTKSGDYVIYVSTLEPRKNHQLLLSIWHQLFEDRGVNCPQLLIVGNKGWGCDDLIEKMMRMSATKTHRIVWWSGVSDNLLKHLYSHSLFAVFPSLYEGWGLAATEAMSFNKVCIVSDNSALTEATQGLMPSFHPLDFPAWINEVVHLIDDSDYRVKLEQIVIQKNLQRSWDEFGIEFYNSLVEYE